MKYRGKLVTKMVNENNVLSLDIVTTDYCNYNCWYCWPEAHAGTKKLPALNTVAIKNLKHIIKLLQGKKDLVVSFSGGEPSMYSYIQDYIYFFKTELKAKIQIITNGSRTLNWWEKNIKYFDDIEVSVHPLEADIDHLIALGELLKKHSKMYSMRVIIVPNEKELVCNIADKFKNNKINVSKKYLDLSHLASDNDNNWDPNMFKIDEDISFGSGIGKTEEISIYTKSNVFKRPIKEKWKKTSLNNFVGNFKGYLCNAPSEYMFLNTSGKMSLTCKNNIQEKFSALNIFEEDYTKEEFDKQVTCTTGYCKCLGLWKVGKTHVVN